MRILTITNLYPPASVGGYEERCKHVTDGLIKKGHQVHVLTSDYKKEEVEEVDNVSRSLMLSGYLDRPWLPARNLWKIERYNQNLLREKLEEFKPEVIHVFNMGGINKSLIKTLNHCGIKVVYDISDHWLADSYRRDAWIDFWSKSGRSLLRPVVSRWIPIAEKESISLENSYYCSDYLRKKCINAGHELKNSAVIHCGVQVSEYEKKTTFTQMKKLLWVGRLSADKDPDTAIQALHYLSKKGNRDVCLDLYGKGSEDDVKRIQQWISHYKLEGRVRIRTASHEEMKTVYSRYDALLFTSNWGEPFALTPIEAMSAKLPVITTTDGGQEELAQDRVNSLIFKAGDPVDLAKKIHEFSQIEDHGKSLAEFAYDHAKNHLA